METFLHILENTSENCASHMKKVCKQNKQDGKSKKEDKGKAEAFRHQHFQLSGSKNVTLKVKEVSTSTLSKIKTTIQNIDLPFKCCCSFCFYCLFSKDALN